MPGGRLTYEDRQRIAAALAAGRSYAEIGRSLGRPRSTISREVQRNGGVGHYRANQAQQATGWRARRRPGLHPSAPVDSTGAYGRDPMALHDFEERFAEMMIQTGVPTMVSRVLVCLFISDSGSVTVAELVARLQVSPASVSKAVAWLEGRALLRRERDGRRELYVIDDHIWYQTWMSSIRSMNQWVEFAQQGSDLLGPGTPAGTRMHTTRQFFESLRHDMIQAAEHWRQALSTRH